MSPILPHGPSISLRGPSANQSQKVTDYLLKRGFNRTEEIFRQESKHLGSDGKPIHQPATLGPKKYGKSYRLLKLWVFNNLDIYKVRPLL